MLRPAALGIPSMPVADGDGGAEARMAADMLRPGEVHVWYVDLDRPLPADAAACLDATERERAGRFRQDRHRQHYLASHRAFRHVVGGYLGCAPAEVRIVRDCPHCGDPTHGKPTVTGPDGERRLEVNASHADGMGAIAVARAPLAVGVDVERLRSGVDWAGVLRQVESEPAPADDLEAFQRWTRVEAVTKAAGLGLAARPTLDRLEPDPTGWRTARVPGVDAVWHVRTLPAPDGYAAALAVDRIPGAGVGLSTWDG
jgi:4'-phosphopantetheinyl transferase